MSADGKRNLVESVEMTEARNPRLFTPVEQLSNALLAFIVTLYDTKVTAFAAYDTTADFEIVTTAHKFTVAVRHVS